MRCFSACTTRDGPPGSPVSSWRTAGGATFMSAASFFTAASAPRSPRTPSRSLAPAFNAVVVGDEVVPASSNRKALRALRSLVAALDAPDSRPASAASTVDYDGLASHPLRSPPRSPAGAASVAGASPRPASAPFTDVPLHDSPAVEAPAPPRRRSALGELTSNALAAAASVFGGGGKRAPAPASGAPAASVGAASVAAALE